MSLSYTLRTACSLCECAQLDVCGSLNPTPLANELVDPKTPVTEDDQFPTLFLLTLFMCRACHHVQLSCLVDPQRLFGSYLYETSTSPQTIAHLRDEASAVMEAIASMRLKVPPSVLEIGSNDGAFLKELIDLGFPPNQTLGIEPSSTMSGKATKAGIPTLHAFFEPGIEKLVYKTDWSVIVANNVFAHVPNVRGALELCEKYLARDGVLVMEVGSAADIFKGAFDVIYHEHMSYHTLAPLRRALAAIDLPMFDVERFGGEVGRGSLRVWAGRGKNPTDRMLKALLEEEEAGLGDAGAWLKILGRDRQSVVLRAENAIADFFARWRCSKAEPIIVGYGAPAKLTTLTYACNVPKVAAVIDDSPWKVGKLTPGERIPIVSMEDGLSLKPDAIIAFAWNFSGAIAEKLAASGWSGDLFVPLPTPHTIHVSPRKK